MSQQSSIDGFFRSLIDFNRAIRSQGAAWASINAEVSRNELIVLGMLVDGEVTRAAQLSERMSVGPSVVSRLVAALESRDLLARTVDPQDRRAEVLTLTKAGRGELRRARAAYVDAIASRLHDWDDAKINEAAVVLDELRKALVRDE